MTAPGSLSHHAILDRAHIHAILSYIRPEERRIRTAIVSPQEVVAEVDRRSPTYTQRPVEYLSASELAISLAQVAHLLIDHVVGDSTFRYANLLTRAQLAEARDRHDVFFLSLSIAFHEKLRTQAYQLRITLDRFRQHRNLLIGQFAFRVESASRGSFTAAVPVPAAVP